MYSILLRLIRFFLIVFTNKYNSWFLEQKKIFTQFQPNHKKVIWIHCSSLGEYEQIKALIPLLKTINPVINITFFSTSGYQHFNDFDSVAQISYLPLDTKKNMQKFTDLMNPMIVVIAKNDLWPNMINNLKNKKIPMYLIGCRLKSIKINNWFIRTYYKIYLRDFSHVFCEDKFTDYFLKSNQISKSSIIKNTRINQILIDTKNNFDDTKIKNFITQNRTIVYGSIEESDIKIIIETINSRTDLNHIIVPHEIDPNKIADLKQLIDRPSLVYSELNSDNTSHINILIIDVFGILKYIYQYSTISYIGGGFNRGVHNTTEAAIYGNLLLFGPKHKEFMETIFFIEKEIASSINSTREFVIELNHFLTRIESKNEIINTISELWDSDSTNLRYILNIIQKDLKCR